MAFPKHQAMKKNLLRQLNGDSHSKQQALASLIELGEAGASQLDLGREVAACLADSDSEVQTLALQAFAEAGELATEFAERVFGMLQCGDEKVRYAAVETLGSMGKGAVRYAHAVAECMGDEHESVRKAACISVGCLAPEGFAGMVGNLLDDQSGVVVSAAITSLTTMKDRRAADYGESIVHKLGDQNKDVRLAAMRYLAVHEAVASKHPVDICKLLNDENAEVRESVSQLVDSAKCSHETLVAEATGFLGHQDPRCRAAAALTIGAAGERALPFAPAVAELLLDTAEVETQDVNCIAGIGLRPQSTNRIPACAALRALARIGDCSCARQVADLIKPERPFDVRLMAAETLGEIGDDFEIALLPLLDSPEVHLRAQALQALGKIAMRRGASAEVADEARGKLSDRSPLVRAAAAEALGCMGEHGAAFVEDIFQLFVDRAVVVRVAAVRAMASIGVKGQLFAAHICRQMYEDGPDVKIASAEALSAMGRRGAAFADEVATLADDHDSSVRIAALIALSKMGSDGRTYFLAEAEKARLDRLQLVRSTAETLLANDCLSQERPSLWKKSV